MIMDILLALPRAKRILAEHPAINNILRTRIGNLKLEAPSSVLCGIFAEDGAVVAALTNGKYFGLRPVI